MIRLLFVCHGNICRSPMAEFIMKELVRAEGLGDEIFVASAATTNEDTGNPVYPPARRELARHGLSCAGKTARRMTRQDYQDYDYILYMDRCNRRELQRITDDPEGKLRPLMSFAGSTEEIADPWYTGDFSGVYAQLERGCRGLLQKLRRELHR